MAAAEFAYTESSYPRRYIHALRMAKSPFAVAWINQERAAAFSCYRKVFVPVADEISNRNKIRTDGNNEYLRYKMKWRGKFAAPDRFERFLALRSKSVNVAAMNGNESARPRTEAQ